MKKLLLFIFFPIICFSQDSISTSTKKIIGVRPEPKLLSSFTDSIPKDADLYVLGYDNSFWKINYFDIKGYVTENSIYKTRDMYVLLNKSKEEKLKEKYGEEVGFKINNGQTWIGMTEEMLIDSKGYPDDKNITKTVYGNSEQWIYGNQYIYVEENKVTAIQK